MELSAYALYEDAAVVLCRGPYGRRRKSQRCLESTHGYSVTSVGRRLARVPRTAIGRKAPS